MMTPGKRKISFVVEPPPPLLIIFEVTRFLVFSVIFPGARVSFFVVMVTLG